jgi:endoglucanase
VKVNNEIVTLASVELETNSSRVLTINLNTYLFYQDILSLSYKGSSITSIYNTVLNKFSELNVDNNLMTRLQIPGKIEAENFSRQVGLETENTSDTGAGKNIGYTDAGDYSEYLIYIANTGNYDLNIRSAAQWNSGKIEFQLMNNSTEESLSIVDLPVTGGWQSWQTTNVPTILNAGIYTLRMKVLIGDFNLNWFEFEFINSLSIATFMKNTLAVFPNPVSEQLKIEVNNQQRIKRIKIIDVNGRIVKKMQPKTQEGVYKVSSLKPGVYFLLVDTEYGSYQRKLIKN